MVYRLCRKIHKATACVSVILFYVAASVSDFHVVDFRQAEPGSVKTLIIWGIVFLFPTMLYALLREISRRVHK